MRANHVPNINVEPQGKTGEIVVDVRNLDDKDLNEEYKGTFLRAFRGQKLTQRDNDIFQRMVEKRAVPATTPYLSTASDADGGFIVPEEVSTMINEYRRQGEFDLTTIVSVSTTAVLKGSFVYEKLASMTPFENITQWETIGEVATPQFENKSYEIQDYAGILPLPRTLLQDTDQNLLAHIAKYIARKTTITRNKSILDILSATYTTKTAVVDVDDIKDVLDLELDAAFNNTAAIVTNQHGYNYLRKLKDLDGNYLVQPDVTQPDRKVIDGKPVVVIPTRTLANDSVSGNAPLYIGDMSEAVKFYDRNVYEITPTTVGGDAFKRNSYDIRVIDRFDTIALDPAAVIACEIDLTPGV